MSRKHLSLAAAIAALMCVGTAGVASAAPGNGDADGHLVLVTDDGETILPAGRAVRLALDVCAGASLLDLDIVNVGDVREVFPDPLEVCAGVELRSQVADEDDD